jgi:hypothetical protein
MSADAPAPDSKATAKAAREARLAKALRANLKRRKAAAGPALKGGGEGMPKSGKRPP